MTNITDGAVIIQTSAESAPSTPSWFGEAYLFLDLCQVSRVGKNPSKSSNLPNQEGVAARVGSNLDGDWSLPYAIHG